MDQIWSILDLGRVGLITGILLWLVGLPLAIRIARGEKPRLVYQARAIPIIDDELRTRLPKKVAVTYAGNAIERLTRTQLAVWNAGGGTVHGEAVADVPAWSFKENDALLAVSVLRRTRTANNVRLEVNPEASSVALMFDYLERNDGLLLEIIHTSPRLVPFAASGSIRGVPKGLEFWGTLHPPSPRWTAPAYATLMLLMGLAPFAAGVLGLANLPRGESDILSQLTSIALGGLFISTGVFVSIFFVRSIVPALFRTSPPRRIQPES